MALPAHSAAMSVLPDAQGTVLCALEHPGEIHMTVTKWCRLCISCEALRRGRSLDTFSI